VPANRALHLISHLAFLWHCLFFAIDGRYRHWSISVPCHVKFVAFETDFRGETALRKVEVQEESFWAFPRETPLDLIEKFYVNDPSASRHGRCSTDRQWHLPTRWTRTSRRMRTDRTQIDWGSTTIDSHPIRQKNVSASPSSNSTGFPSNCAQSNFSHGFRFHVKSARSFLEVSCWYGATDALSMRPANSTKC